MDAGNMTVLEAQNLSRATFKDRSSACGTECPCWLLKLLIKDQILCYLLIQSHNYNGAQILFTGSGTCGLESLKYFKNPTLHAHVGVQQAGFG